MTLKEKQVEFEKRTVRFYKLLTDRGMSINNFDEIANKFSSDEMEDISIFVEDKKTKKLTWCLPLGNISMPKVEIKDGKITKNILTKPVLLNAFNPKIFQFSFDDPISNYAYVGKFSELIFNKNVDKD